MKRIIQKLMLFLIVVGLALANASSVLADSYTFTPIDVPYNNITHAFGINSSVTIVGTYRYEVEALPEHSFLRDAQGNFTPIDFPGARFTFAFGISGSGSIVGRYVDDKEHGFLRDAQGNFYTIDFPDADITSAQGINSSGNICGFYISSASSGGFLRDAEGNFTTIEGECNGINDAGNIVGSNFLRDLTGNYTPIIVSGAIRTEARGIDNSGNIVGSYKDATGFHGFLRDAQGNFFYPIDAPVANGGTFVTGINDAGKLVGYYVNYPVPYDFDNYVVHGFIATPSAEQLIKYLINKVNSLGLKKGITTSLDAELQAAEAALDAARANDVTTACRIMNAFMNEISALSGKQITEDQTNQLIALAKQIKEALDCP